MVNPDGVLRLDRLGEGRVDTGNRLEAAEAERIIRLVASHVRAEVHGNAPIVSAELPECGERFEGLLPPVTSAPSTEEHSSELPSLMRTSYASFCLKKTMTVSILTAP